ASRTGSPYGASNSPRKQGRSSNSSCVFMSASIIGVEQASAPAAGAAVVGARDDLILVAVEDLPRRPGPDLGHRHAALAEQGRQSEAALDHLAGVIQEPADPVRQPDAARLHQEGAAPRRRQIGPEPVELLLDRFAQRL